MAFGKYFILAAAVLLFIAQGSFALQCAICDSASDAPEDKGCGNNTQTPKYQDCSDWCKKRTAQSSQAKLYGDKAEERIIRACGFADGQKEQIYRSSETTKSEIYSCSTNECNSAGSMQLSVILSVFTVILGVAAL
ncbi:hypothetical protein BV898_14850 [Hypsibius exemplaris]|uniref:UPAR/Ly6 domain-containing protein n=1 Tax=Hypsibius exemplaris TaxID=2072580 RepID=A0A9X6RJW6_HYPEX|nr:hypothetical protein BV898_14850 [Hypsibius exemplaris]